MTGPRNFYTHTFSHKKVVYVTTTGKSTKTLSTVSEGNRGRFEPVSGDAPQTFLGRVKNATHILFTDISTLYEVGHIIQDADGVQYNIVYIANQKFMSRNHHAEIQLEQRNKVIA